MAEAEAETEITHRFSQMDWIFEGKMFRFTSKSYVHIHIGQGGWCNVVWGGGGGALLLDFKVALEIHGSVEIFQSNKNAFQ